MEIKVNIKQLGKKQPILKKQTLDLQGVGLSSTLKIIIESFIEYQINDYDRKLRKSNNNFKLPKKNNLPILLDNGKVGFNNIYNKNNINLEKSKETAIQAFKDGTYAVFYGEEELNDINQTIEINTDKAFTFIRLTFLTESNW